MTSMEWLEHWELLLHRLCGVVSGVATNASGAGLPLLEPVGVQPGALPELLVPGTL